MSAPKPQQNPPIPEKQPQHPKIVQVVGNYLVGPTVGRGFFAKVKRVEDPYRQVYAMKCFDKEQISRSAHSLRQVEKEINALRLCNHPNIVRFHEVLEVENSVYLVMEFVPHGELFDYIKQKGRLSEPEAVHMARQILSTLSYCHSIGIAHRDVKPENVLIDAQGNIKLVDFGLCSFYSSSDFTGSQPVPVQCNPDAEDTAAPAGGVMLHTQCGSPHYAAPEVLMSVGYHGPSADIWSFGVLLYAMVTGSLPFTARVIPQLVQKIVAGVYRMPAYLSPLCKHVISGILRVNPKDRLSVDDILAHPWFTKAEPWVPSVPATLTLPVAPVATGKRDLVDPEVATALSSAAAFAKRHGQEHDAPEPANTAVSKEDGYTCRECGGALRPKIGANGMVVLGANGCHCAHSIFAKAQTDAQEANAAVDERGGYMQMPRLFSADTVDVDVAVEAEEGVFMSALPVSEHWRPPQLDYTRAVTSEREYALIVACERGDLREVRHLLFDADPCPGVLAILSGQHDVLPGRKRASDTASTSSKSLFALCGASSAAAYNDIDLADAAVTPATHGDTAADSGVGAEEEDVFMTDYRLRSCVCEDQRHRLDLRVGGMDKWTCLHHAARAGHQAVCEELLQSCLPLDVNAVTKNHWTALMFAADRGHEGVVEVLLRYRADIHTVSSDGKTAIFLARERQHASISKRLTEASSVRHLHSLQHHSLVASHAHRTIAAAAAALSQAQVRGDGPGSRDKELAPLRIARASRSSWFALSGLQAELVEACEQGDVAHLDKLFPLSVQFLEGPDYDEQHAAEASVVEHGDVQVLVPPSLSVPPVSGAQVDLMAKGIDNWTLLHFAARRGQTRVIGRIFELMVGYVRAEDIVALLDSPSKTGWTPLMMAVDKAHVDTVKLLLKCGADVNKRSNTGETAYTMTMMYRDDERYKEIIEALEEARPSEPHQ